MASFSIGQPIHTREPTITVDAGLSAGEHRFQLVVTREDGRVSRPDVAVVTIVVLRPTPITRPR